MISGRYSLVRRLQAELVFLRGSDELVCMGAREDHARRIIAKELGVTVECHDDGTRHGAYDLRVGPAGAPQIAIECTGAHDQDLTKLRRTMAKWGRFELSLDGDWAVSFHREAASMLREVKEQIEVALRMCEQRGEHDFLCGPYP